MRSSRVKEANGEGSGARMEENYLIKVRFVDFSNIEIQPTEKVVQCDTCKKIFSNIAESRVHRLTHSADQFDICKFCNKNFSKKLLNEHLKSHPTKVEINKNCFECSHCQKQFQFIDHLLNHFKVYCKNLNSEKKTEEQDCGFNVKEIEVDPSNDRYNKISNNCIKQEGEEFNDESNNEQIKISVNKKKRGRKKKNKVIVKNVNKRMLRIRRVPKLEENNAEDNENGVYTCNYCLISFDNSPQYETHLHEHKKVVHENIKGHYTSVKIVNERKECTLCGTLFTSVESSLFDHVANIHPEIKISKLCLFCGKLFATKNDLDRHIRCHTGEKPFMCTECPYSCSRHDNLKKHLLLHNVI